MSIRLSVLVAAYNAQDYIAEALISVFEQGIEGIEAIVVDDGSSDATTPIVENIARQAPSIVAIKQVRKIRNEGMAAARNTALAKAQGEHAMILDADDVLEPGSVAALLKRWDAQPATRLVFPRYRWVDKHGSDMSFVSPEPEPAVGVPAILLDNPIHSDSGVVASRHDLEALGGFDTGLTGYIGADMWMRFAIRHGSGSLACAPGAFVRYRRHDSQITADWRTMDRNWNALLEKLDAHHSETIAPLRAKALARHRLYCSALAYKSDDYPASRRLLRDAVRAEPLLLARSVPARTRLLACLVSLLPGRMHRTIRERFG